MRKEQASTLEMAVLGLLIQRPRTGYAVRQEFSGTPMGHYSDSPGSIYPALRRLEARGWIERREEPGRSARPTRYFAPTAAGRRAFMTWLRQPVTAEDVSRGMAGLVLRLAFMGPLLGPEGMRPFFESLRAELAAEAEALRGYLREHGAGLERSARYAVEHGLRVVEAELAWARDCLADLCGGQADEE